MDKKRKKIFSRILILSIVAIIIGVFACFAMFNASEGLQQYFSSSLVNSESVYLMLALCAFVAVSLTLLIFSSFRASQELRHEMRKMQKAKPDRKIKQTKKNETRRFAMLNTIDKQAQSYKKPSVQEINLEQLCISFRDYAAGNLGLYYDISDIRRFIAGMSVTRLILLQGMSGTGKTSLAYAMGHFIENDSVVIPIQPMWKERSDMIGYFNEFTKKFNETTLLRKMYEALYHEEIYITILDEANISRIEYYFAEFLSLLELPEVNERYLDVVSDVWENDPVLLKDGKIKLPPNMWFVGTANNDDSTFAISDKVYDRAMVINLDKRCVPFDAQPRKPVRMPYSQWCVLIDDAKRKYALSREAEEKIKTFDAFLVEKFRLTFGNRIMKQIRDYVPVMIACGGTEKEAIDDMLSRKVLRKLEQQNPVHVKMYIAELISFTENVFEDKTPICLDYLKQFEEKFNL